MSTRLMSAVSIAVLAVLRFVIESHVSSKLSSDVFKLHVFVVAASFMVAVGDVVA